MAGEQQYLNRVTATPTISTSAYASGQVMGGLLTFSNAFSLRTCSGILLAAEVTDKSKQDIALELLLFGANPSSTTFTDQTALTINATDLANVLGVIYFNPSTGSPSNHFIYSNYSVHYVGSLAIPIRGVTASQRNLYAALIARGAGTWATSSDVSVMVSIEQD